MDKPASSPRIRSPLSSIINLSNPISEEAVPDDDIFNASVIDLGDLAQKPEETQSVDERKDQQAEAEDEETSDNNTPQILVAKEVQLHSPNVIAVDVRSRSQSLDIHYPTQLDTITEVSVQAILEQHIRPQRSRSLDEGKFRTGDYYASSSSEGLRCLPILQQYPKLPENSPPQRPATPLGLPEFNTLEAATYRRPISPHGLREHPHSEMPSETQALTRQRAELPAGIVFRADDGTLVRGIWTAPRSDHTGSSRHRYELTREPFGRTVRRSRLSYVESTDMQPRLIPEKAKKERQWKRFYEALFQCLCRDALLNGYDTESLPGARIVRR